MKSPLIAALGVLLLAGTGFAQAKPHHSILGKKDHLALKADMEESSSYLKAKEYGEAIKPLADAARLMEKALGFVKSGKVNAGDKAEAIEASIVSQLAGVYYNLACCYSRTDKHKEALDALKKAVDDGFTDVAHMKHDSDLDPIRGTPTYEKIISSLSYNDVVKFYAPESLPKGKAPVLIALHGAGGNEEDALKRWKALADAENVLLVVPRGPITLGRDHYAWRRMESEKAALKKIDYTIGKIEARTDADSTKIYILGVKDGGYFAYLYGLMHPAQVKGVIGVNSYWNRYYFEDFLKKAKIGGIKVCLVHGKDDPFYSAAQAGEKSLKDAGVGAKLVSFPGGKKLPDDLTDLAKKAFAFVSG